MVCPAMTDVNCFMHCKRMGVILCCVVMCCGVMLADASRRHCFVFHKVCIALRPYRKIVGCSSAVRSYGVGEVACDETEEY